MKNKTITALNHSSPWSYLLFLMIIFLSLWYGFAKDHTDSFWEWIDPVAGIMTFITTLAIFGFQAYQKWEDSLEKLLTVNYIYTGGESERTIVIVENAYLAGEGDIRAWAQALGGQIMGNLDFDMNWDDPKPEIINTDGEYKKCYSVILYLTDNPFRAAQDNDNDEKKSNLIKSKQKVNEFLNRKFKHSIVEGDLDHLPIKWIRK